MDYQRKVRWVNYHSEKCKMYLRNDFNFECVYCRMKEKDAGVCLEDVFEKDHFSPKSKNTSKNVHAYTNMVYACQKCNNTKSNQNIEVILDPCKDDIYTGKNPHVVKLGALDGYMLKANTSQGEQFINSLHLNARYYRQMRMRQSNADKTRNQLLECFLHLKKEYQVPNELLKKIALHMEIEVNDSIEYIDKIRCGTSSAGEAFQKVLEILKENDIYYNLLFDEYEKDIQICFESVEYFCEIVLNSNSIRPVNTRKFNNEKLKYLSNLDGEYGELYYYEKTGRLELFIFNKDFTVKKRYCIYEGDQ